MKQSHQKMSAIENPSPVAASCKAKKCQITVTMPAQPNCDAGIPGSAKELLGRLARNKTRLHKLLRKKIKPKKPLFGSFTPNCEHPEGISLPDRCNEMLEILWADSHFWEIINAQEAPETWKIYAQTEHKIDLPIFASKVWLELARYASLKKKVFSIFCQRCYPADGYASGIVGTMCGSNFKNLVRLFEWYIENPSIDRKHLIASLLVNKNDIKTGDISHSEVALGVWNLKIAAQRFAKDATWCLNNPGKIPQPAFVPKYGKDLARNPKTIDRAWRIEALLELVKKNPALSDKTIAIMMDDQLMFNRERRAKLNWAGADAGRKDVRVARRLAVIREGIRSIGVLK